MEHGNGCDFDYFEHEIVSIDIPNRQITYRDNSQDGKIVTLERLHTITELATRKFLPVNFEKQYRPQQIGSV